jgi:hypothetical protein
MKDEQETPVKRLRDSKRPGDVGNRIDQAYRIKKPAL